MNRIRWINILLTTHNQQQVNSTIATKQVQVLIKYQNALKKNSFGPAKIRHFFAEPDPE